MELLKPRKGKKRKQEEMMDEDGATLPLDSDGMETNYRTLLRIIPEHFGKPPKGRAHVRIGTMATRPWHLVSLAELMYETGLRVSDAIMFAIDKVREDSDGWGRYTTVQIKTGTKVTVAIPPYLLKKMQSLKRISAKYVFYDGVKDMTDYYRSNVYAPLREAGEAAGIPGVSPHRFRDSFAVNRLNEGMPMSKISKLLGHTRVATTEKYYAPFVRSVEDTLMNDRKVLHNSRFADQSNVVPIRTERAG